MTLQVLVTDRALNIIGDPITRWTDIDVTLRFNEPDTGTVTVPSDGVSADQLADGNRLVIIRNREILTAGPLEVTGERSWSISDDPGSGTTKLAFSSDLAAIVAEVVYPDPAHAITAQALARRVFTAAMTETVMRQIVRENVGPTALPARQIPGLVVGAGTALGGVVSASLRLDPLGDALRSIAVAGGGLGFRTKQVGSTIEFEVFEPRDLRSQVRFSRGMGNLTAYTYTPEIPTATVAIVAATGEGDSRVFYETVSSAASTVGRMVVVVDNRGTDDTGDAARAAAEALAEGGAAATLTTSTIDIPTQRFGEHYGIGDRVSVVLADGTEVADIIRAVNLKATPEGGEVTTPTVGTQSASNDPAWVRDMRAVARRVARLEAI